MQYPMTRVMRFFFNLTENCKNKSKFREFTSTEDYSYHISRGVFSREMTYRNDSGT